MITKQERNRVFNVMRTLGLALWHEVCTLDVLMQVILCFDLVSHSGQVFCLPCPGFVQGFCKSAPVRQSALSCSDFV